MAMSTTSKLKAKDPKDVVPGKIKMMIFGKSGIGKTWISLDFPKPYYIDAEGGARLAHYQAKLAAVGGSYFGVEDAALNDLTVGLALPVKVLENLTVKPAVSYVYLPDADIRDAAEAVYGEDDAVVGSVTASYAF